MGFLQFKSSEVVSTAHTDIFCLAGGKIKEKNAPLETFVRSETFYYTRIGYPYAGSSNLLAVQQTQHCVAASLHSGLTAPCPQSFELRSVSGARTYLSSSMQLS